MDNPIYIALSRQMILRRQMDIVANNIANADTAGFKVEQLVVNTDPERMPNPQGGPSVINYVIDSSLARDFSQGSLSQTGNPLDLAIEGDAFFTVATANGERYTRDGRFTVDGQGRLVTQMGEPVQGEGGDIVIDPSLGPITIAKDGGISQGPDQIGRVAVVRFDDRSGLTKEGDGLYSNRANVAAQPAADAIVHQGMIESSNVKPILQITDMIEVSRAYERMSKIIDQTAELDRRSIERLGRVS